MTRRKALPAKMRICSLFNDDLPKTNYSLWFVVAAKKDAIEEQIKQHRTIVPGGGVLFRLGAYYYIRDWERTAAAVVVKETH